MENLEYIRELLNELSRYNNAEHLSPVQTDITLLLKSIIRSFRPALDYLGITLETDIPQTLPLLCLDQTKIHQALLNLQKCPGIHSALSRRYLCYGSRCY